MNTGYALERNQRGKGIRSWEQARAYLGTKTNRPLANNTRIARRDDNAIGITLHGTEVITFWPPEVGQHVTLNTGGWRTSTTKARLNASIPEGWQVYQERGEWFLSPLPWGESPRYVFADGITISADGTVSNAGTQGQMKERGTIAKRIRVYVRGYFDALLAGNVPAPSAGDCWYCALREVKTNKPLGEASGDTGHLEDHFKESYYVPSLLVAAIEEYPISIAARARVGELWGMNPTNSKFLDDVLRRQGESSLRRYLRRQFAIAS